MAKKPATSKAKSKSTTRAKSSSKKRTSNKKPFLDFQFDFSKEKVIEVSGIILLVFGIISLIMTFFAKQGSFFAKWPDYLLKQTGIFSYVIPMVMIITGAWFLLSRYEQFPLVTIPRLIGAIALVFNLITWFQFFHAPDPTRAVPFKGGGVVGNAIYSWFHHGLGTPGAVIMLIAWLLIALVLLVNLSLPALLAWTVLQLKKTNTKLSLFIQSLIEHRKQKQAHRQQIQQVLDSQASQTPIQAPLELDPEPKPVTEKRSFVNPTLTKQAAQKKNHGSCPNRKISSSLPLARLLTRKMTKTALASSKKLCVLSTRLARLLKSGADQPSPCSALNRTILKRAAAEPACASATSLPLQMTWLWH